MIISYIRIATSTVGKGVLIQHPAAAHLAALDARNEGRMSRPEAVRRLMLSGTFQRDRGSNNT
jgi:hypothetical protein